MTPGNTYAAFGDLFLVYGAAGSGRYGKAAQRFVI
jgi:hypothetical protein